MNDHLDPNTMNLARLIAGHPNAQRGLALSIERQRARQQTMRPSRPSGHCPHCGASGVAVMVGDTPYFRRRDDCCQRALFDAATAALKYAMNVSGVGIERNQEMDRYEALRLGITDPDMLADLDRHHVFYDGVDNRVTGLTCAQGGVDTERL